METERQTETDRERDRETERQTETGRDRERQRKKGGEKEVLEERTTLSFAG